MSTILYSKYNRSRKEKFQTCTSIVEENGERFVVKYAITEQAKNHVDAMLSNREKLQKTYSGVSFVEISPKEDGRKVSFPFLTGEPLDQLLIEKFQSQGKDGLSEMKSALERMYDVDELISDRENERYQDIFGDDALPCEQALAAANLDMIFDNVIVQDDMWTCIDYEWVLDCPIPVEFLKYRALYYFYGKYRIALQEFFEEEEFYEAFGFSQEICRKCFAMEERFQQYVFGKDRESRYQDRYQEDAIPAVEYIQRLEEINNSLKGDIERLNDDIERLTLEKEDRDYHISILDKQLEEKQQKLNEKTVETENLHAELNLKYQHIAQLDMMIPAANKWMKFRELWPIRVLRFGKRCLKAIYHRLKKERIEVLEIPQFDNPKVSIVIPAYNQFEYTYACVKSIIENTQDCTYEVILGDDVSTDKTKHIQKYIHGITVSRNKENLRFLRNCNNAAKLARGEYIFFLNNDTTVNPEWLSSLVELIESDDTIGMVGSKLVYPNGTLQEAGGIIWADGSGWNYGRNGDPYQPEFNYVRDVDYISGAAIMIRHSLWKEIGGFDELFNPAYCEDSDLAFEVRKHGYRVVYQPKSVVVHYEGVSNGTDLTSGVKKYQVENNEKLKKKWAEELSHQYKDETDLFKARERNYGAKTVLFIDHYVPTYDKDAGSKTTFQYIKMFVKQGYRVKFIGDNFASFEPYTTVLEQMGVEVLYGYRYSIHIYEWIKEHQKDIDFVYLNRPHISEKYVDFIKNETNIKMIYYGHDLHYLRVLRESELTGDRKLATESRWWRNKEFSLMEKVDVSYYPSSVEVDAIHEIRPNLPVKAITAYVFEEFQKNFSYDAKEREGLLFVGGFAHQPNVDAVKWFVREIYPLIWEREKIPFYIVGSNAPQEIQDLNGDGIVFKGFVSEEELDHLYKSCRMVVVPLRYGAGVKGKVVEALYYGTPLITTNVGAEGITGVENVAVVADEPAEIVEKVMELYHDDEQLECMAMNSQNYVKENFSIDAVWNVIKEDFE